MADVRTYFVEAYSPVGFAVTATGKSGTMVIDQPGKGGVPGGGPSPVDALLSSLAGCVVTTARIMARQQGVEVTGIQVTAEGWLDLEVVRGKSGERSGLHGIAVGVRLETPMSDDERKEFLLELQRRCPIADTLSRGVHVTWQPAPGVNL